MQPCRTIWNLVVFEQSGVVKHPLLQIILATRLVGETAGCVKGFIPTGQQTKRDHSNDVISNS